MNHFENRGHAAPLEPRLWRAALLAAAGLAVAMVGRADEFRLFPPSATGPRYVEALDPSGESALRLVDLERSYPWRGGEGFRIETDEPESPIADTQEAVPPSPPSEVSAPPKKLFTTTTTLWTVAALLGGVGQGIGAPIKYGTNSWHFTDEKWFQYDTYAGGADKASHFVISSGLSRLLYEIYIHDGHTVDQSFNLALATTLMAGIFVETGDAFTVYGWSWQDLTADFLGATSGLLIHRYHLQDLLGLRVGPAGGDVPSWAVGSSEESLGSSYNDEIFTADLKLGGLVTRLHGKPGITRYFLTSFVYYTRGFGYEPPLPSRYQEAGIELGINFPAILKDLKVPEDKWWGQGLYAFFNFFRIPYTQIGAYYNFKNKKWYGPSAPYHYYSN
jgi:uncharacterized protein YfiM (DUF2279 family)